MTTPTHFCNTRSCSLHGFRVDPLGIKDCIECGEPLTSLAEALFGHSDLFDAFFGGRS